MASTSALFLLKGDWHSDGNHGTGSATRCLLHYSTSTVTDSRHGDWVRVSEWLTSDKQRLNVWYLYGVRSIHVLYWDKQKTANCSVSACFQRIVNTYETCLKIILKHLIVVLVVVGQTVGSISSKTLAYDCLYTLELCTESVIATS